jgi:polyphosphate kinase
MPRNLDRRVEVVYPIDNPAIRRSVIDTILKVQMTDNVNARKLNPDGSYERLKPDGGQEPCDAHAWFIAHRGIWHEKQKAGKKISPKNRQSQK